MRGRRLSDGSDGRIPILHDVVQLAQTSQTGEVRADIWRQLNHVTDPALLDALAHDPDARTREEAAEPLASFFPDPAVEAALQLAAEHDPDPDVHGQAGGSLSGRRK